MLDSFFNEIERITASSAMHAYARSFFEKNAMPPWASSALGHVQRVGVPVLGHAAAGAVPGALAGAAVDKKDRKRGALVGAGVGAATGIAGGHVLRMAARDRQAMSEAARAHKFNDAGEVLKQPYATKKKVWDTAAKIKADRPLYGSVKTSAKKEEDPWERPSDSPLRRYGPKAAGGALALATGGVAGHRIYTKHKVKSDARAKGRKQHEVETAWQRGHGTSAHYPHRRPLTQKQLGSATKPMMKPTAPYSEEARFGKYPEGSRVGPTKKKIRDITVRKPTQGSFQNLLDALDEQMTGKEYIHHDPKKFSQRVKAKLVRRVASGSKPTQLKLPGIARKIMKHASVDDVVQAFVAMN
jgi:hypothetical protein